MRKPLPLCRVVPFNPVLSKTLQGKPQKPESNLKRWTYSHLLSSFNYIDESINQNDIEGFESIYLVKVTKAFATLNKEKANLSTQSFIPFNHRFYNKMLLPMKKVLTLLLFIISTIYVQAQTANNFNSVVPYTGPFEYGMNPGWWGSQFTNPQLGQMAFIAGSGSFRINLADYVSGPSNGTGFNNDLSGYAAVGLKNNVGFLGSVWANNQLDSTFPGCSQNSLIWRGTYQPIWTDSTNGIIDTANRFANYVYQMVVNAGSSIKYWEIINEADFTGNTTDAGANTFNVTQNKQSATSWWNIPPAANDLVNLKAPIFYYIHMLKIAYSVIKKLQPTSYVAIGGIGYPATLDVLMRYTDNPVDGSVTTQFPLTGGAYFDVINFHTYPMYNLNIWNNSKNAFDHFRFSDKMIDVDTMYAHQYDSVQVAHGYNNSTYPKKIYISTETDAPQDSLCDGQWGSLASAINYTIKWNVASQAYGLKQLDKYALGSMPLTNTSSEFNHCGLYGDITPSTTTVANAPKTQEFYGYKTMSTLLYGKQYDAVKTASLNLPSTVRGYAFNDGAGNYTYVLWAKTTIDLSESANANYTFPFAFSGTRMEWNYSSTNTTTTATQAVALTGYPSFFVATAATAHKPPVVNAGTDQLITLPVTTVTLTGSATDSGSTVTSYSWSRASGPVSGTITSNVAATTTVIGLTAGVYKFVLTVTDNLGATGTDTMQVTVNIPPVAHAGNDTSITLPSNSVTLNGSASDVDGTIASYQWSQLSGTSATITNGNTANASVTNLVQGVYQFTLTVTDNSGATGTDTVQVTVKAANIPPTANAGSDQTITLPVNNVTLNGSGTDVDGTIASYQWSQISGTSATITNGNTANASVTNLLQGVYQFTLTVTDNSGATGTDTVQVTVNAANIPPTANAGSDQTITLPVNNVTLSGSGTDVDGTIASYQWSQLSGTSATITNGNTANVSLTNLVQGVYQFVLTVTDNSGATGTDTVQVTVKAANIPPTANAGEDQTITLPVNNVTLNGSGTDIDGTIASYQWSQLSGTSATITNGNTANASVSNLVQGVYQFTLTVTDNSGAKGIDTVQVTVNAANIPPTANAGSDQTITLPINNLSLNGNGTDENGIITSYSWTQLSGPSVATITNVASPGTEVTGLVAGSYQFELVVTDNEGAIGSATVQVTVKAANIPPTANAGEDQTITLPVNNVTLNGSGTDVDGTIASYQWSQLSGTSATITNGNTANASVTNLVQGVYQFTLTVTDNSGATGTDTVQVTVKAANIPPTANAGSDQTITLPVNNVTLSGSGTDVDGTIASYQWSQLSGTSATITNGNTANASVTNLVQGVYQFTLTVTDNSGATGTDTVQVTVKAANIPPTANAGSDQTITLPVNNVTLNGSGTDVDGTIASYQWSQISGTSATITNGNTANASVTNLLQGVYQFTLTVTDNSGATGTDTVQVTVNAANIPPTANAGSDQTITLPVNNVTLSGSGTDVDGTIASYQWSQLSGTSATITNGNTANVSLTNLVQGVYQFVLTVTDNSGATGTDTVQVTVKAANIPPTANAGEDQTITLPVNNVTLSGSGTDVDGTIASYQWSQLSGTSATITNGNTANASVTNLVQGVYQFVLTVTDNSGATGTDTMEVDVNLAPIANAGTSDAITLPINSVTLNGSGVDVDGTVTSYQWSQLSGPSSGVITNASSATTSFTALVQGVYELMLTVTDNDGATGTDSVQIAVNPANAPPTADAGPDQVITLPTNNVTLSGSGTDVSGTISSYQWMQISGPSTGTTTDANSAGITISGLVQGVYQFAVSVTDNNGLTASDTVQVTVNAGRMAQVNNFIANAGPDQVITLPNNSTTLSGSATDDSGTIISYQWTSISGPSQDNIDSANSAQTSISNLVEGVYQYQLTVTDNNGLSVSDTVQVTVTESESLEVTAAPNPVQTTLVTQINNIYPLNQSLAVTVINSVGASVYSSTVVTSGNSQTVDIDVSKLKSGIYFLNVSSKATKGKNKFNITKKIIRR